MAQFRILSVKDRKDGGADIALEYDKDFADLVKTIYGAKKCTKALVQKLVIESCEAYLKTRKT